MKIFTFYFRVLAVLLGMSWLGLRPQQAQAQSYSVPTSGTTSYTTCSGTLSDDGGASNFYSPNSNGSVTLLPATAGNKIKLEFTSFALEVNYDFVYVYDGTSTSAPLLGTFTGTTLPGTLYASTTSGALTIRLTSDDVYQAAGFTANISCVTTVPLPDLTLSSVNLGSTTLQAGGTTAATATITNSASAQASSSNLGYYLSTDNVLSSNDVLLASSTGSSLAAGASSTRNTTLNIPTGTAVGSYYVLFVADYLNQVSESNETNNVASLAITIQAGGPDLVMSQQSLYNSSVSAGSAVSASAYVYNQGNQSASSSNVGFYLSTNSTLDANDVLLTTIQGSALGAGLGASRAATLNIPAGTTPGSYYVLFVADPTNLVAESSETNNVASATLSVVTSSVDLTIYSPYLNSTQVVAGNTVSCSSTLSNLGNTTATPATVGYYLSTNSTLDANDVLIGNSSVSSLSGNNYSYIYGSPIIPANTAAGTYYVLFVADYLNQVTETNESNNVSYASITVATSTVDLYVSGATISPSQTSAGSYISTSGYLYNQGNTVAGSSRVGYYLSTNNTLDANDILIGNSTISSVSTGYYGYSYINGSAIIPSGTATGSYYVLFVADYLNQLTESNENNNVSAVSLTVITPSVDLSLYSAYISPSQTTAGTAVSTSGYLYNQGNISASPATVGYYLSTNNTLDANDILIGNSVLGSVGAGSYGSFYGSAAIPAGTAAGSYYVLFVADYLNQLTESNESNNVSAVSLTVITPSVDLSLYSAYISPSQTTAGTTVSTSGYLYNQGNTTASPATVGYYLSTNNTLDANDILIGNSSLGSVSASYYSNFYGSAAIPAGTAPGSYYVLFVADYLNQLTETNENNNVSAVSLTIQASGPDLSFPYTFNLSTSQAFAGSTITTTCYLANTGTTAASPATVGYYLSTNNTLDANDILIGNSSTSSISAGNYATLYGSMVIPANTAAGSYYVLFVADYLNQLTETNETNNLVSLSLQVSVSTTDLSILSPAATPTTVANGGIVAANCFIFNSGTTTASSSTVGFYLSTNTTFDENDVLLGTSVGGSLGYTIAASRSASLTIPVTTQAGSYYLLFVADPTGIVAETNENNNVGTVALTVTSNFNGYAVPFMGSTTITACSGTVYDNGGTGDYANNSNGTLTIRPGTTGMATQLTFTSFNTELYSDYLYVYDGLTTNAPLIGSYSGAAGISLGSIRASNTNTSGALTLRFVSNSSYATAGFQANISCVQILAAREQTAGYELNVFPNPVSAAPLRVQLSGLGARTDATLTLRNSLGQLVVTRSLALLPGRLNQTEVETTGLAAGVYLLQLTGTDLNATRRVVIE